MEAGVSGGSDTIRGYPVAWTVSGTDPKTVVMAVTRPDVLGGQSIDSFVMVVPDWGK